MRILVVDDDVSSMDALRGLLELDGHRVVCAENGREALELLREADGVGLIVVDLMMPVMDGWEFRREQLQDSRLASIPVVVVTANERTPEKAKRLGAEHCLQKPLSPKKVLDLVRSYSSRSGGSADGEA